MVHKVKFPLLEFCAHELSRFIPSNEQVSFCDKVHALKTEGGNVILGIMLQNRLSFFYNESIAKAVDYISVADIWYVCDIIGERVFGFALLNYTEKTILSVRTLSLHNSNWVIRSLGAGIHYAIKKGLDKEFVKILFRLLLTMAKTNDKEIRQG